MQANSGNPSPGGLPVGRFEGDTYYALEIRLPSTVTSAMRTGDAASRSRAITSPVLRLMRPNSNTPVGQLCTQAEQRTHCVFQCAGLCRSFNEHDPDRSQRTGAHDL